MAHIEARHLVQIKQFASAEERRIADTRALLEIQCKGLSEEQKASAVKECNSKIGHRQTIDKKRLDHIRETQRMELRHFKEKSDAEVVSCGFCINLPCNIPAYYRGVLKHQGFSNLGREQAQGISATWLQLREGKYS